jgi:hypothetical protein
MADQEAFLEYVVQHLGGQAPHALQVTHEPRHKNGARLCPNIHHKLCGENMTLTQWFDCMEKGPGGQNTGPTLNIPDLYAPNPWVFRTPTHVYCQDAQTLRVQKFGRVTPLTLSGGIINAPSLQWLPQFNEACRRAGGTTLVICESAALSALWQSKCGAHSFGEVSRGSRRAGDGLVGVQPCPDMPSLVVATQATVTQQLLQHAKSAMHTCHFDRVVMHMARAAPLDQDLLDAVQHQWPSSWRWLLCMATLKPCHLPTCFAFLRLRHVSKASDTSGFQPCVPASLDLASPKCTERLFKLTCWNSLDATPSRAKVIDVQLNLVEIKPSETERMLLTRNRRCEADAKFYADPTKLYMAEQLERFEYTHSLDRQTMSRYYGDGDFEGGIRRLMSEARPGSEHCCCVCLDPIPKCATLVLPCCHTLCTMCYDGILSTGCVTAKCPMCKRELPDDQEPLLWVRAADRDGKNSKLKWAPARANMINIGGPHSASLDVIPAKARHSVSSCFVGSTNAITLWDTRLNTLHRAALAVVASMDAGHKVMIYALLWQHFDQAHDVVRALMQLLPDTCQLRLDADHTA